MFFSTDNFFLAAVDAQLAPPPEYNPSTASSHTRPFRTRTRSNKCAFPKVERPDGRLSSCEDDVCSTRNDALRKRDGEPIQVQKCHCSYNAVASRAESCSEAFILRGRLQFGQGPWQPRRKGFLRPDGCNLARIFLRPPGSARILHPACQPDTQSPALRDAPRGRSPRSLRLCGEVVGCGRRRPRKCGDRRGRRGISL